MRDRIVTNWGGKHQTYCFFFVIERKKLIRFEVLQSRRGAQKMRLDVFYMMVPQLPF